MPLTEPACRLSSKPVSNLRYGVYTNKSYRISQTCVIYATHCLVYTLITCPIYFAFTSGQIVLVRQSADTCMLSLKDWKAAQCRWAPDGFLPCIKQSWCVLFFFFLHCCDANSGCHAVFNFVKLCIKEMVWQHLSLCETCNCLTLHVHR